MSTPNDSATVPSKAVIYTTASGDYDWWFMRDLGVAGMIRGKTVRRVELETARVEEQCDHYASGCHMTAGETEWTKLVRYKLPIAVESIP